MPYIFAVEPNSNLFLKKAWSTCSLWFQLWLGYLVRGKVGTQFGRRGWPLYRRIRAREQHRRLVRQVGCGLRSCFDHQDQRQLPERRMYYLMELFWMLTAVQRTFACRTLACAFSGNTMPPFVLVTASNFCTKTRSSKGINRFTALACKEKRNNSVVVSTCRHNVSGNVGRCCVMHVRQEVSYL